MTCCSCYRMPQNAFFSTNSRSSGQPKKHAKTLFFPPSIPFHGNFCNCNSIGICTASRFWFSFHCYTQRETTPTQKSARKCAATFRDFLRERLQSAFTLANQLRRIAQQSHFSPTSLSPHLCLGPRHYLFGDNSALDKFKQPPSK